MKTNILTASILAATLVACGGDGDDVFDVPDTSTGGSSSSSGTVENTPATLGNLSATVTNSTMEDIAGTVSVADPDSGEDAIQPLNDESTMYGVFSISDDGAWVYSLDTTDTTIASLAGPDDSVVDVVEIQSVDGTAADLEITITGADTVVSTTQAARITDNMIDDAGELRYKFDEAIEKGKLTVSFLKDDNAETADGSAKDAYIGLFGSSTSTSQALVDLRIQADKYVIRDRDDIDVEIPFTPGEWTDVEVTWDASAASADVTPLVTITINGVSVTTEPFSSAASIATSVMDGVEAFIFKLGDNGSTIPVAAYHVDNVKVYSDIEGTMLAFEDDFEGYTVGDSLDPDENADSVYHGNTAEVVVANVTVAGGDGSGGDSGNQTGPGSSGNKLAKITDSMIDDAGELRYKLDSAISEGKLSVSFLKDDNAQTADGSAKDAYIGLFGSSTSTSKAIVDLRIQADKFAIRDKDDIAVEVPFTPGIWTDVEMTWDASSASADVTPLVTITINGTSVTTEAFASASASPSEVMEGVEYAIFKLGDNGSTIPSAAYHVDDVKIFSDLAGTAIVFEDDFEAYSVGDSLDPDDNSASVYHSNSAEVVVDQE
ncbi:VCBS domain-containing protein [Gilvimarinus sp. SDUM040013]|uniref:VCBS domain-containing protein n=1 Tax=Gilvimarinus gilvus TaxID=3058038 RepID=A0ABU4S359_9GAMM|nr:VCBS domain-containing protein [Gilvimarinus sp. SDUM040013]MDO3384848.1 VCBS domain-containing protein [Gilvimarinus sp. SDUM040013]MDX6851527.1 VCBS domain-containing protein [Gilvimarinus sp. SDUM040013]